jgi:membrane protease YdiL (CAAX protease family)
LLGAAFAAVQLAGFHGLAQVPANKRGRVYEVTRRLMPETAAEALIFFFLVITVATCEEFLYRGFALAAFGILLRGRAAPVIASAVLFGVGHLYQGRRGITMTTLLGLVFASARVFTGSLLPGVLAHFVVDLLAGFAAPGGLWGSGRGATVEHNL